MCIAIVIKAGATLSDAQLWKGWTANEDGGGFAYVKNDKVEIEKGFMKYNDFQKAFRKASEEFGADSPFLVHMRIGTSGGVTPVNTHPFEIKPQHGPHGAMIHNGILFTPSGAWAGNGADKKSDTRVVASALNNILVLEDIKNAKALLGNAIGAGNKLAFLYDNKEFVIINEHQGYWKDEVWYSNAGCNLSPAGFSGR